MKNRTQNEEGKGKEINGAKSINMKRRNNKKPNNLRRGGHSLEDFDAKSNRNYYNPALIKKNQEFYKNAKYISKFKKSIKQQGQSSDLSVATRPREDGNETIDNTKMNRKNKKRKTKGTVSLKEIYEKKHEEQEKARLEREAIIQAKKDEREKANARRKATREKMFKKTRTGQPVMKYRIEHLLETIQGSKSNS